VEGSTTQLVVHGKENVLLASLVQARANERMIYLRDPFGKRRQVVIERYEDDLQCYWADVEGYKVRYDKRGIMAETRMCSGKKDD